MKFKITYKYQEFIVMAYNIVRIMAFFKW